MKKYIIRIKRFLWLSKVVWIQIYNDPKYIENYVITTESDNERKIVREEMDIAIKSILRRVRVSRYARNKNGSFKKRS